MATQIYLGLPPPNVVKWIKEKYKEPEVDMLTVPLHFIAEEPNATIIYDGYMEGAYEISYTGKDDSWISYNTGTRITLPNIGDKVYFRAFEEGNYTCEGGHFSLQKNIAARGNILSLLDRDFTHVSTVPESCFHKLFENCTTLTKAPELPATTLAAWCYEYMFSGCTSLIQAPTSIPATTLAQECCHCMFYDCTSLIQAPELLVTTLADTIEDSNYGCGNMFENCTSLKYASFPNLDKETVINSVVNRNGAFDGAANNIEATCKDGILIINSSAV